MTVKGHVRWIHLLISLPPSFQTDLLDKEGLEQVFINYGGFRACIHFAGLKAVGESVAKPLWYYENNLTGTLHLLDAMQRHGCRIIGE